MAGALSGGGNGDMDDYVMASMSGQMDNEGGGALSAGQTSDAIDYQGQSAASPQELRNLQLLAEMRGLNTGTHNGSSTSQYGEMLSGDLSVAQEAMKQNALFRARLAEIQANKSMQERIAEKQIAGRSDVARIMAGKSQETLLSDDDLKNAGLPPGTTAAVNPFGKIRVIHSPPASQQMLTGFDDSGKPTYAPPGAALTPAMRTSVQTYLKGSQQVLPQLDSLITDLSSGKAGSAMGLSGIGERAIESTVGQVADLNGRTKAIFPKDAALRTRMEQLNELAAPTLEADPRIAAMGEKRHDAIQKMLPDPDSWHTDVGESLTKLKQLRDQLKSRNSEYSSMLKGEGLVTDDNKSASRGMSGTSAIKSPPTPSQINEEMVRQHAAEAIANGKDPASVAKLAKERYGVDINATGQ